MCVGEGGELRDGDRLECPLDTTVTWLGAVSDLGGGHRELSGGMRLFSLHETQ